MHCFRWIVVCNCGGGGWGDVDVPAANFQRLGGLSWGIWVMGAKCWSVAMPVLGFKKGENALVRFGISAILDS